MKRGWMLGGLRSPDGGGGGGNKGGSDDGGGDSPRPNLEDQARRLSDRHGGGDAAIVVLLGEARDYRRRIRELEGRVPGEGQVALTADQAKAWQAYQALGTPDQVQVTAQERDTLKGQVQAAERDKLIGRAAQATGFHAEVLAGLAKDATIEVREVDGKAAAFVKATGGTETPLAAYAEANWKAYLPALKQATPPAGTSFVSQRGSDPAAAGDVVDAFLKERADAQAKQRNPLMK